MGQFFVGDRAGGGQILTPREVRARAAQRDFACGQFGLRTFHGAIQTAHLTHGLGQVGFGLLQGHLGVGRIQLHQQLAALHAHAVFGADADHGTAHHRGDLHLVALHIRIVGVFVPTADQEVPHHQADDRQDRHNGHDAQRSTALAGRGRCGLRRS